MGEVNGFKSRPKWSPRQSGSWAFGSWKIYHDINCPFHWMAELFDEFHESVKIVRRRSFAGCMAWILNQAKDAKNITERMVAAVEQ